MHPAHLSSQDVDNAWVALIFIVVGMTLFGRAMLRVAVAILVVAVIVGVITLLQSVHL
jgi:hypothetical protein